jgi:hypothetical protein
MQIGSRSIFAFEGFCVLSGSSFFVRTITARCTTRVLYVICPENTTVRFLPTGFQSTCKCVSTDPRSLWTVVLGRPLIAKNAGSPSTIGRIFA